MKKMLIYTDGSSLNNPGDGGWGVIFFANKKVMEMAGYQANATNNQMEMMAIYKAFETIISKNAQEYDIQIYSDSKYVIQGLTEWIESWIKNGWKNSAKKEVKNKKLWQNIYNMEKMIKTDNKIKYFHVKAHNGQKYNERVDDIARFSAMRTEFDLYVGKEDNYLK
ncbi:ribonuclease HI [Candidatus Campbellbacteria bacterium]|nr:MAG: ribonuclease HI [Candidatus Campbellbacteria bacterium]